MSVVALVPRLIASRPAPDGVIMSGDFVRGPGASLAGGIRVDCRLRQYQGAYKISDIVIDGLSMAISGRSEIEDVAECNGPAAAGHTRSNATAGGQRAAALVSCSLDVDVYLYLFHEVEMTWESMIGF